MQLGGSLWMCTGPVTCIALWYFGGKAILVDADVTIEHICGMSGWASGIKRFWNCSKQQHVLLRKKKNSADLYAHVPAPIQNSVWRTCGRRNQPACSAEFPSLLLAAVVIKTIVVVSAIASTMSSEKNVKSIHTDQFCGLREKIRARSTSAAM